MSYPHLSSPGRIGGVTLKNRIAMTAASASLSEPDGSMTEAMLAYYEARAKGGGADPHGDGLRGRAAGRPLSP